MMTSGAAAPVPGVPQSPSNGDKRLNILLGKLVQARSICWRAGGRGMEGGLVLHVRSLDVVMGCWHS